MTKKLVPTPVNVDFLKTLVSNLLLLRQIFTSRKGKELLFSISHVNDMF